MIALKFDYKKGKIKELKTALNWKKFKWQTCKEKSVYIYYKSEDCFLEFLCKAANGNQSFKEFQNTYECKDNYLERIDYRECVRAFKQFEKFGLGSDDINNLINEIGL